MIIKGYKILVLTIIMLFLTSQSYLVEAIPGVSAQSYIVMDADSLRVIGSRNPHQELPIASTTKILTTILAIESIENVDQKIEVPAACAGIEGSSIYLQPRQKVSIKDLLYGTMLRSGNDAAATLAAYAGRNTEGGFVEMMNQKASEIGANNSNFMNPHGLHNENHYSTAYDLALISSHALKNDLFRDISSSKSYKAESMNTVFYNKNKVVHQYEHGNGIKIGYTKAAGRCLVASAEKDGTEIVVVVLNDGNWFQDSYNLFDWAFANYNKYSIVEAGQFVGKTSDGTPVFIEDSYRCILTQEEKSKVRFESEITIPHLLNNEKAIYGSYEIFLGDELIHTGNLVN